MLLHRLYLAVGRAHAYLAAHAPHLLDEQFHHRHRLPHRQLVYRQVGAPILAFPQLEPCAQQSVHKLTCTPYTVRRYALKDHAVLFPHRLVQPVVKLAVVPLVGIVRFLRVVCLQSVLRLICVRGVVGLFRMVSFQRVVALLGMGGFPRQFSDVRLGCVRRLLHRHAAVGCAPGSQCRGAALVLRLLYYLDVYHCSISFSVISAYPSSRLRLMPCTKKVLPIIGWR